MPGQPADRFLLPQDESVVEPTVRCQQPMTQQPRPGRPPRQARRIRVGDVDSVRNTPPPPHPGRPGRPFRLRAEQIGLERRIPGVRAHPAGVRRSRDDNQA